MRIEELVREEAETKRQQAELATLVAGLVSSLEDVIRFVVERDFEVTPK